jgi:putative toxin-antitoxin system antitoxin component (TIGR02293 family)
MAKKSKIPPQYPESTPQSGLVSDFQALEYSNNLQKMEHIRRGMAVSVIENLSDEANIPVKRILQYLGMPQTTYNKKKREGEALSVRDTELIIAIHDLLQYGLEVFNHQEDAFIRWLSRSNPSLAGYTPESLFDTLTGVREVHNTLQSLDFGNFA